MHQANCWSLCQFLTGLSAPRALLCPALSCGVRSLQTRPRGDRLGDQKVGGREKLLLLSVCFGKHLWKWLCSISGARLGLGGLSPGWWSLSSQGSTAVQCAHLGGPACRAALPQHSAEGAPGSADTTPSSVPPDLVGAATACRAKSELPLFLYFALSEFPTHQKHVF